MVSKIISTKLSGANISSRFLGRNVFLILHVFRMFTPKSIAINNRHARKARNFHQCYDYITELVGLDKRTYFFHDCPLKFIRFCKITIQRRQQCQGQKSRSHQSADDHHGKRFCRFRADTGRECGRKQTQHRHHSRHYNRP